MDILFGQSYFLRFDPKLYDAMQPYPPLGTLYAAAIMRERGYQVALFDAMLSEGTHEWDAALDRHAPRYAVIYEDNFNYLSKMSLLRMREAALAMIKMAQARGCVVIVCGSDASDHPTVYLQAGADYVILGEGDATLPELIDHLHNHDAPNVHDIPGIAYLDALGSVARTLPRPVISDLDALPFPAWDLVDRDRYQHVWRERHGYYSMNLVTTRGCPFHCNWCAKPIWGQRYHVRSPEDVVAEMQWLKDNFAPDHIWFMDDIMGIQDRWIEQFADQLDEAGLRIPFKSLNRVDLLLRGRAIPALARAGAQIVWVGAESGSQKILDAMDKGTTVKQIYEATRQLHAHGVKVAFFLQFGYPGETREDIELTLKMVRDLLPDDIGISVSYPLPGTKFYDNVKHELGARANWVDSADLAMLYQGPFRTEFYRQLHTVVHKEYRARKTAAALRSLVRDPRHLRPALIRQSAAMIYHTLTLPAARAELDRLAALPHAPTEVVIGGLMD
ncbi:MAG: B12-binding domain-containing radical SAM protein [Anaerolineae bacterium]|nr:B12-binding domain-containing radical SAM protein [Anaerolineae bacterium]